MALVVLELGAVMTNCNYEYEQSRISISINIRMRAIGNRGILLYKW